MSLKHEDLVMDLFYTSSTNEAGDKQARVTIQIRDEGAVSQVTTQLIRTTMKATKAKVYAVGEQSIKDGSDPLLVAIESYYRQDTKSVTETLMAEVTDFLEGNLGSDNTYLGIYGITILSGAALVDYLPPAVISPGTETTTK